jgi:hypothetical protein
MLFKRARVLLLILFGVCSNAFGQVVPHAKEGGLPLTVGLAYSNFHTDWSGRLSGSMVWANWHFGFRRPYDGLGVEIEARDLNYGRTGPSPLDPKLRQQTATIGPIYNGRHYYGFQPYAKFMVGLGGIYFSPPSNFPNYTHDTRTVFVPGGGLNCQVHGPFSIRGDYEYQFWPSFLRNHTLNPNGFSVGASYDFRARIRR